VFEDGFEVIVPYRESRFLTYEKVYRQIKKHVEKVDPDLAAVVEQPKPSIKISRVIKESRETRITPTSQSALIASLYPTDTASYLPSMGEFRPAELAVPYEEPIREVYVYRPPRIPKERVPRQHGNIRMYPAAILAEAERILAKEGRTAYNEFLQSQHTASQVESPEVVRMRIVHASTKIAEEGQGVDQITELIERSNARIAAITKEVSDLDAAIQHAEQLIQTSRVKLAALQDEKSKLELFRVSWEETKNLATEVSQIIPTSTLKQAPALAPGKRRNSPGVVKNAFTDKIIPSFRSQNKSRFTTDEAHQLLLQEGIPVNRATLYAMLTVMKGDPKRTMIDKDPSERGIWILLSEKSARSMNGAA
jgi:hypothetical protein